MTPFERRLAYKTSMSIFRGWRSRGAISDGDYVKIEAMMAEKYGLPADSISRCNA